MSIFEFILLFQPRQALLRGGIGEAKSLATAAWWSSGSADWMGKIATKTMVAMNVP